MKEKILKNKKILGIIAVAVLVVAGFLIYDHSQAQTVLARNTSEIKTKCITTLSKANSATSKAKSKEKSLRKSYDKEAKEKALKKMKDKGKYGKYTYINSKGKKVSCNRERPAPTYSYSSGGGYSGGYSSGGSYSGGSSSGGSSSGGSSGGSSSSGGNWTINGGTIDLGNYCGRCGAKISGSYCPNCDK